MSARKFNPNFLRDLLRKLPVPVYYHLFRHNLIPNNKELLRKIMSRSEKASYNFTTRTFFGGKIKGNTKDIIQRYIYFFGVWEPNLTRYIGANLLPGDVFVDVGSNIGYYSVYASKLVGTNGRVVSIEASPSIFRHLLKNISINGATNIRSVNCAAANEQKTVKLYRAKEINTGKSSLLYEGSLNAECEIEAYPLVRILNPDEAENARIIKIDVEGAEHLVLTGMMPLLASGRSDLEVVVEINPGHLARQGKTSSEILDAFDNHGFYPYRIDNDYSPSGYLSPSGRRPERIKGVVREQMDVIFSRRNCEFL